jgi:hypothetical protein
MPAAEMVTAIAMGGSVARPIGIRRIIRFWFLPTNFPFGAFGRVAAQEKNT